MKKKKSDDKAPVDFKNTPFTSLKRFSPSLPATEKKEAPRRKNNEPPENESELFFRAVTGTRKIDSEEVAAAGNVAPEGQAPQQERVAILKDRELFLKAMQKIGTNFKELHQQERDPVGPQRRSSSSRVRQLKRGTIRISKELDLHGYLRDEALKLLEQFISGAFGQGHQAVLVITGKGINSPEGPVLQGAVSSWLRDRGKNMVAEFAPAPRDLGGSGAFVVFLRKQQGRDFFDDEL